MNGVVEAANLNIKKIVENMTKRYKGWPKKLLFTLHAYRTIVQTFIGATLFFLVYGMESILLYRSRYPSFTSAHIDKMGSSQIRIVKLH